MKVTLNNFRCYKNNTFDFGDNGLILISGVSGQGKTTILLAIYFALFGNGIKVQSYGSSSCAVTLEFEDLVITRTKRPNRLVVNDTYEDEVAQEIINRRFGIAFDVTSYISQNALNSFILMSPTDKLEFIEKFAFKDVDLGKIKEISKKLIYDRHEILNDTISKLELSTNVLNEMEKPEEVKFPYKTKKSIEEVTNNEHIKYKNCNTLLTRHRKKLRILQDQLSAIKVMNATVDGKESILGDLQNKISKIKTEISSISFIGDERLVIYKRHLRYLISTKELTVMKKQYDTDLLKLNQMKIQEFGEYQAQIENIKNTLWIEYTKEELQDLIQETKTTISDLERMVKYIDELAQYEAISDEILTEKREKLERLRLELEEKIQLQNLWKTQKESYTCPSCTKKLRFKDNLLYLLENLPEIDLNTDIDNLQKVINTLKTTLKKLEISIPEEEYKLQRKNKLICEISEIKNNYDELPDIISLKEDLQYLLDYDIKNNELERKLVKVKQCIKNEKFSSSYETFCHSVTAMAGEINRLENNSYAQNMDPECINFDEEQIRHIIVTQEQQKKYLSELTTRLGDYQLEVQNHTEILEKIRGQYIKQYEKIVTEDELISNIEDIDKEILAVEERKEVIENTLSIIEKYKIYSEKITEYDNWTQKVSELKTQELEQRDLYAAATLLKEKILEAESIYISSIVDSINIHASVYLEHFFPDNPMSVQLQSFKYTKKNVKPQISAIIHYKDMECDLNTLSGGELSRVILAYTLALAEIFNSPLLLLDECTASLDETSASNVFETIKEHFNNKMCIVIGHQMVAGMFDHVISL
uniref:Rad50/SbcC-type AAA domain-containing protein n=1 Tax=viral metagenome TaxID=1070528 RepID=A0A6C0CYZ2_9ZZZZ